MPAWIVFDAVGTLIRPNPSVADVYRAAGARHGSRLSREQVALRFRESFAAVFGASAAATASETNERDLWREIVVRIFDDLVDAEACFQELFDHFARPSSWELFPDAAEAVRTLLERGQRVAIASNFDHRLHDVCAGLPPLDRVPYRLISSELGHRKPNPEFYRAVVRALETAPEEIVMVGDDFENDVAAPRRAGLRAIWIDRRGTERREGVIHSLRELV